MPAFAGMTQFFCGEGGVMKKHLYYALPPFVSKKDASNTTKRHPRGSEDPVGFAVFRNGTDCARRFSLDPRFRGDDAAFVGRAV